MDMRVKIAVILFFIFLFLAPAHADTVITEDGKESKGIVVEDYRDRLILST